MMMLLICHASQAGSLPPLRYYDIDALSIPKFFNVNYIEVEKISQISKFRSSARTTTTTFSNHAAR